VILDVTQRFRQPVAESETPEFRDPTGPRDPGFIPVIQLNCIFGRNVPCAAGPFSSMTSPQDKMLSAPAFQQLGVQLILDTLQRSDQKIDVLSFGSARPIAVAFNRAPDLLRQKVRCVHLCAGASSPDFLEWNVQLDPHAMVCLLRCDLPVPSTPAQPRTGPSPSVVTTATGSSRTSVSARNASATAGLPAFAFSRSTRMISCDTSMWTALGVMNEIAKRPHNVWETAVWMQVADLRLVRRADGACRIIPANEVKPADTVLPNELRPCTVKVSDKGLFGFELTEKPTKFRIYDRGDPVENERALRQALPVFYQSFVP